MMTLDGDDKSNGDHDGDDGSDDQHHHQGKRRACAGITSGSPPGKIRN